MIANFRSKYSGGAPHTLVNHLKTSLDLQEKKKSNLALCLQHPAKNDVFGKGEKGYKLTTGGNKHLVW